MKFPRSRSLLTLAVGLATTGWFATNAQADPITYSTIGMVGTPTGGTNLVYFNGMSNATLNPTTGIDIGQFNLSSLASTTSQTYSNTPFQIIVSSGNDASDQITGTINGMVGPGATTPLTATVNAITQFANNPLPFAINLPTGVPMTLNTSLPGGTGPATTDFVGPVTVPEPASAVVFALSIGGLSLWVRRRRAA